MNILKFTKEDEDIKFLLYCVDQTATMELSTELSLNSKANLKEHPENSNILSENTSPENNLHFFEGLDPVVERLFGLFGEEFNSKKLVEFKKLRKTPILSKNEFSLLNTLSYINVLRETLISGSMKHKESIDKYTKVLSEKGIKFDPDFLILEIRAGLIKEIDNAEGLDKLYCEKVLTNKEYFICSGLRQHYEKEELLGNTFLFLLNIKKVKFRTLESEGMICCTEGEGVEALKTGALPGTRIELENQLTLFSDLIYGKVDISKNSFKLILSDFKVADHYLTFRGSKVLVGGKHVVCKTLNGPVR